MLRPDIKKDWTEALDSGRYQQGYGSLKNEGGYCCLGVAGHVLKEKYPEVLEQAGWNFVENEEGAWFERPDDFVEDGRKMYVENAMLPDDLAELIGLQDGLGRHSQLTQMNLASCNDDKRWDFHRISIVIREDY